MPHFMLSDLLAALPEKTLHNFHEQLISDITNDSRQVKPGSLFVAVRGHQDDGHKYISAAVAAGAVAVVCEQVADVTVPQIVVSNARLAQALLACHFFGYPSHKMNVIGVTGTNGKTTSTFMINQVLERAGHATGLMGTLYNKVGERIMPTRNTTPDSIVCQRLLADMVNRGISHAVMEVSSHATLMHRVTGIRFKIAAVTNISTDHLDLHKSMEEYLRCKQAFFEMLTADDFAVANIDDTYASRLPLSLKANRLYYGMENPEADIWVTAVENCQRGTQFRVAVQTEFENQKGQLVEPTEFDIKLAVPGRHNVYNALLAATTMLALGCSIEEIVEGLESFRGIFRRYEVIYDGEFRVIDDATHNPGNMEAVFQTAAAEKAKDFVVVYAIRGNRGVAINRAIAATLRRNVEQLGPKLLIITRCQDTASSLDVVQADEERAFFNELRQMSGVPVKCVDKLRDAVRRALEVVEAGDVMLLLGAHPMDSVAEVFSEEIGEDLTLLPRPPRFGDV